MALTIFIRRINATISPMKYWYHHGWNGNVHCYKAVQRIRTRINPMFLLINSKAILQFVPWKSEIELTHKRQFLILWGGGAQRWREPFSNEHLFFTYPLMIQNFYRSKPCLYSKDYAKMPKWRQWSYSKLPKRPSLPNCRNEYKNFELEFIKKQSNWSISPHYLIEKGLNSRMVESEEGPKNVRWPNSKIKETCQAKSILSLEAS